MADLTCKHFDIETGVSIVLSAIQRVLLRSVEMNTVHDF